MNSVSVAPNESDLSVQQDCAAALWELQQADAALSTAWRDHQLDPVRTLELVLELDRHRDFDRAFGLVLELDRSFDLGRYLQLHHDLAHVLDRAVDCDLNRNIGRDHDLALDREADVIAGRLAREAADLGLLRGRVLVGADLAPGPMVAVGSVSVSVSVRPSWAARGVYRWTAWLLSSAARARFGDELLDELFDLADQRASRYSQMVCACRQLGRVLPLRHQAGRARRRVADASGD